MAKTLKFGENGKWATKTGSSMAYNDQNGNFKPMPFSVTRDSIATRVNKEGLIEVVGKDKLRIDYTDSSNGVALLEPSRTNRFLYSQDLIQFDLSSSGTGASNPVVTSNYGISPDGTQNADRVQLNAGTDASGNSRITETFTIFATEETISVYLKSNDGQEHTIDIIQSNLAQDTVTVTSEWQRFSFTRVNSSPDKYGIGLTGSNGETADVLAWGFQLETGSYATSYIPTQGETNGVTRSADVANGAGNAQVFNDSEGVLFANVQQPQTSSGSYLCISNGTITNRLIIGVEANLFRVYRNLNLTTGNDFLPNLRYNKFAVKYNSSETDIYFNGFKISDSALSPAMSGLDRLSFDSGAGAQDFYGKAKEIGYYDAVLTDAELEALTSYTSFANMANELNLTIK